MYEGKGLQMEKSKKSRADAEHELDQLQWSYDDGCQSLQTKFEQIEGSTEEDSDALKRLVDAQFGELFQNFLDSLPLLCLLSLSHLFRVRVKLCEYSSARTRPTRLFRICPPILSSPSNYLDFLSLLLSTIWFWISFPLFDTTTSPSRFNEDESFVL
jgi:hypothetical protein